MQPPPRTESESSGYYYIAASIVAAAVLLLVSNLVAFTCCSPTQMLQSARSFLRLQGRTDQHEDDPNPQLIPTCKYSGEQQAIYVDCAVCLSAFVDGEDVRQMPGCKHLFHAPCIDMWLYSHSDCPLCRATVLPPRQRCAAAAGGTGGSSLQGS